MGLERTTLAHLNVLAACILKVLAFVATFTFFALLKIGDSFDEKRGSTSFNFSRCRIGANIIIIKKALSLTALATVAFADKGIPSKTFRNLGKRLIVGSQSKIEVCLLHFPLLLRTQRVQSTVDLVHRRILGVIFWVQKALDSTVRSELLPVVHILEDIVHGDSNFASAFAHNARMIILSPKSVKQLLFMKNEAKL